MINDINETRTVVSFHLSENEIYEKIILEVKNIKETINYKNKEKEVRKHKKSKNLKKNKCR